MRTDTLPLHAILHMGDGAYARTHAVPDYVRRAVWALLACRTAVRGGHVQACPEGHLERVWDNSCRHRMCPPWAWLPIERWLARQKVRLLACEHDHGIFTLPHELHDLWLANVDAMSQLLLASGHDPLVERLGDRTSLGATPGSIATRPTWSQTRLLPPHLQCLVTGGGLTAGGPWVAGRNGFLRPMRVVMARCRGKLRAAIREGLPQGRLTPPRGQRRQPLENRLNQVGRATWHVQIRERDPHGQGGLSYWARYLRGGPLAHRRLLACAGQQVVFRFEERATGRGGQAPQRTLALPLEPCLGRWLLHVPPSPAVRVRGWGLDAHPQGEARARCRQQVGQGPVDGPKPGDGPGEDEAWGEGPPACGPVCGPRVGCTALRPRVGVPPPAARGWEQVA